MCLFSSVECWLRVDLDVYTHSYGVVVRALGDSRILDAFCVAILSTQRASNSSLAHPAPLPCLRLRRVPRLQAELETKDLRDAARLEAVRRAKHEAETKAREQKAQRQAEAERRREQERVEKDARDAKERQEKDSRRKALVEAKAKAAQEV